MAAVKQSYAILLPTDAQHWNAKIKVYITRAGAEGGGDSNPIRLRPRLVRPEIGCGLFPETMLKVNRI
jgi:hypothetical protein